MRNRIALPLFAAFAAAAGACSSFDSSTDASGDSGTSISSSSSISRSCSISSSGSISSGNSTSSSDCTDGGSSSDGGFSFTAVCGTTPLKDLTGTQTAQLCSDTFAYFGRSITESTFCQWQGLISAATSSPQSDSDVQTQCTTTENSCEASDAGTDAGPNIPPYLVYGAQNNSLPISNCFEGPINSSCTATVAQYANCINDETAAFITTVKGFMPCAMESLTAIAGVTPAESVTQPSCEALQNACAGLTQPDPLSF